MRKNLETSTSGGRKRPVPSTLTLDFLLAAGLVALLTVYLIVTVITYTKITITDSSSTMATDSSPLRQKSVLAKVMASDRSVQRTDNPITRLQHTFPIHVGKDVERITHPGLALTDKKELIPQNLERTMLVPKFFDESHGAVYEPNAPNPSIRHWLGSGGTLLTPEQAANIGSFTQVPVRSQDGSIQMDENNHPVMMEMETIYCSIASYRDPECRGSVEDLYIRAKYPERIRVAILDQRVLGEDSDDPVCTEPERPCDEDPEQSLCKYRHLIDSFVMDARLAVGPVFARHLAHRHYRGEYFAMQIDSHVRFTHHWDDDIVGQWKSAHNEMGVLTTYLSDIIDSIDPVTHASIHYGRPIMCASDYEGSGDYRHLRHGQQPEGPPGIKGQPTLHPFWAAGFSFARGHFVIQIPYDQYLPMVFQGEEISIGLRGFTYGYDYYAPERSVCFHMYAVKENIERRKKVPLFWENSELYSGVGMKAMRRLNSIIGMASHPDSSWQHDELGRYGLGQVRNTSKFFSVFGIHVEKKTVEHHLCRFVGKPMMKEFLPVLRTNRMGLDYDKIKYEFKDPTPNEKP